jgi:hypothetical protein
MVFGTVVIINLRLLGVFETRGVRPPDTFGIIGALLGLAIDEFFSFPD